MSLNEISMELPAEHMTNVFGQFDLYVKKIERSLGVTVICRDEQVKILGDSARISNARQVLSQLIDLSKRGSAITEQNVDYAVSLVKEKETVTLAEIDDECVGYTVNGKPIKPKTLGQKKYVDFIHDRMIVFGTGPAGTGKTYLAMAMAVTYFKKEETGRIILTRPAIEAGEKLGFLPGDLQSKVDPYLRPLYDALHQIMGADAFMRNMEKGLIEVAPLAYMRGRTLDNSFIILDEAQNTTPAQMKMFLTRIGFGSKVVITGDAARCKSGLDVALQVLKNVEEIGICELSSKDVVRHPLVQKIVNAYEIYEKKQAGHAGHDRRSERMKQKKQVAKWKA